MMTVQQLGQLKIPLNKKIDNFFLLLLSIDLLKK